jgi:hypothetical protein
MFDLFKSKLVTARQARLWPYCAVFVCFAAVFLRFPGEWDSDTVNQNSQMMFDNYRDWHPPLFAAFWSLLNTGWNAVTGMDYTGSGVLYVAHAVMLWAGLALLIRAGSSFFLKFVEKEQWKLLAVLAALLFFGLFEMVPMTRFAFKDTAMMASYILALGIMLNMPRGGFSRWAAGLGCLLLLFYGTGVRHNAIFALLPLLALLVHTLRPAMRLRLLVPLVFLIWAGVLAGINLLTYDVLKAKKEYSLQEIIFTDYWKINYATDTYDPPPVPGGKPWGALSADVFFKFYNKKSIYIGSSFQFVHAYYGSEEAVPLRYDFSANPEDFKLLQKAWLSKVKNNLSVYISFHKEIFVTLLRQYSFMGLSGAVFFVFGILISIAGAVRLLKRASVNPAPYLIAFSGLLYVLPYIVAVLAIQRRYLFWFFFATFLSVVWLAILFASKYRVIRDRLDTAENLTTNR